MDKKQAIEQLIKEDTGFALKSFEQGLRHLNAEDFMKTYQILNHRGIFVARHWLYPSHYGRSETGDDFRIFLGRPRIQLYADESPSHYDWFLNEDIAIAQFKSCQWEESYENENTKKLDKFLSSVPINLIEEFDGTAFNRFNHYCKTAKLYQPK